MDPMAIVREQFSFALFATLGVIALYKIIDRFVTARSTEPGLLTPLMDAFRMFLGALRDLVLMPFQALARRLDGRAIFGRVLYSSSKDPSAATADAFSLLARATEEEKIALPADPRDLIRRERAQSAARAGPTRRKETGVTRVNKTLGDAEVMGLAAETALSLVELMRSVRQMREEIAQLRMEQTNRPPSTALLSPAMITEGTTVNNKIEKEAGMSTTGNTHTQIAEAETSLQRLNQTIGEELNLVEGETRSLATSQQELAELQARIERQQATIRERQETITRRQTTRREIEMQLETLRQQAHREHTGEIVGLISEIADVPHEVGNSILNEVRELVERKLSELMAKGDGTESASAEAPPPVENAQPVAEIAQPTTAAPPEPTPAPAPATASPEPGLRLVERPTDETQCLANGTTGSPKSGDPSLAAAMQAAQDYMRRTGQSPLESSAVFDRQLEEKRAAKRPDGVTEATSDDIVEGADTGKKADGANPGKARGISPGGARGEMAAGA